ncbi:hypothetical protein MTO96_007275 [Rhipicephalus appendiculatus]
MGSALYQNIGSHFRVGHYRPWMPATLFGSRMGTGHAKQRYLNENGYESGLEDCEPPDIVGPTVEGLEAANCPDNAAAADPHSTRVPEETEQTESAGDPSELPTLRRSTRSRTEPKRLCYDENFRQLC